MSRNANVLPYEFFQTTTKNLAKKLLGTFLVHKTDEGTTVGRIVETEAYLSKGDPACHASRGKTKRNAAMFGPPGCAYVYFIYGMYHCFNVVSAKEDVGEAVLIRALEPVEGLSLMEKRRKTTIRNNLCNGPGKLVLAMGLDDRHNGLSLLQGEALSLCSSDSYPEDIESRFTIVTTTRVGISNATDLPLRFYVKESESVSKK